MKTLYNMLKLLKKCLYLMPFLFCLSLYPETLTYLVRVSSFPDSTVKVDLPLQARQAGYDYLVDKGKNGGRVDFENTRLLTSNNSNFRIYEVTPQNASERTLLNGLVNSGHIALISSATVVTEFDSRRGAWTTKVNRTNFGIPDDFYPVKGVAKSTP